MSQKDYCQFISAGFKELYNTKRHFENPMYNFCEEIILEPSEGDAVLGLVTSPMESIGIHSNNLEGRELILEYTACLPNLQQFFCKDPVEKIEKNKAVIKDYWAVLGPKQIGKTTFLKQVQKQRLVGDTI